MSTTTLPVFAALLVVLGLVGCVAPAEDEGDSVGIAFPSESPRWMRDAAAMRDLLEGAGHRVEVRFAGGDIPTQVSHVEQLIESGADALIVAAIDTTSLTNALDEAGRRGIVVLAYDRLPLDTTAVDCYVTYDRALAGRLQAWSLLHGLGLTGLDGTPEDDAPAGPFTIELYAGPPGDGTAAALFGGAMAVLQPLIDRGVLAVGSGQLAADVVATAGWDAEAAETRLSGILEGSYPDDRRLDAVLSPDDRISAGITTALADAGYDPGPGFPLVSGRGAGRDAVRAILAGEQYATVLTATRELAIRAAETALAMLDGELPETTPGADVDNGAVVVPTILVPPVAVVADNARDVLLDDGYWTEDQIAEVEP